MDAAPHSPEAAAASTDAPSTEQAEEQHDDGAPQARPETPAADSDDGGAPRGSPGTSASAQHPTTMAPVEVEVVPHSAGLAQAQPRPRGRGVVWLCVAWTCALLAALALALALVITFTPSFTPESVPYDDDLARSALASAGLLTLLLGMLMAYVGIKRDWVLKSIGRLYRLLLWTWCVTAIELSYTIPTLSDAAAAVTRHLARLRDLLLDLELAWPIQRASRRVLSDGLENARARAIRQDLKAIIESTLPATTSAGGPPAGGAPRGSSRRPLDRQRQALSGRDDAGSDPQQGPVAAEGDVEGALLRLRGLATQCQAHMNNLRREVAGLASQKDELRSRQFAFAADEAMVKAAQDEREERLQSREDSLLQYEQQVRRRLTDLMEEDARGHEQAEERHRQEMQRRLGDQDHAVEGMKRVYNDQIARVNGMLADEVDARKKSEAQYQAEITQLKQQLSSETEQLKESKAQRSVDLSTRERLGEIVIIEQKARRDAEAKLAALEKQVRDTYGTPEQCRQRERDASMFHALLKVDASEHVLRYTALRRAARWIRPRPHEGALPKSEGYRTLSSNGTAALEVTKRQPSASTGARDVRKSFQAEVVMEAEVGNTELCVRAMQLASVACAPGADGRDVTVCFTGQSGSGKSYSIWPPSGEQGFSEAVARHLQANAGTGVTISYRATEYARGDRNTDLLNGIRDTQDPAFGAWRALSAAEFRDAFDKTCFSRAGLRTVRPTPQNPDSTRGHAVFEMRLSKDGQVLRTFATVDLCGREEKPAHEAYEGHTDDWAWINSSRAAICTLMKSANPSSGPGSSITRALKPLMTAKTLRLYVACLRMDQGSEDSSLYTLENL